MYVQVFGGRLKVVHNVTLIFSNFSSADNNAATKYRQSYFSLLRHHSRKTNFSPQKRSLSIRKIHLVRVENLGSGRLETVRECDPYFRGSESIFRRNFERRVDDVTRFKSTEFSQEIYKRLSHGLRFDKVSSVFELFN